MAWCKDYSWHVCFIIETSTLALCNNFILCYALAQSNEMHLHFHTFTVYFHMSTLTYHSQYSEAFKFSEFVFTKHNEGAKSEFAIILFGDYLRQPCRIHQPMCILIPSWRWYIHISNIHIISISVALKCKNYVCQLICRKRENRWSIIRIGYYHSNFPHLP